jgi:hypothetical protein
MKDRRLSTEFEEISEKDQKPLITPIGHIRMEKERRICVIKRAAGFSGALKFFS